MLFSLNFAKFYIKIVYKVFIDLGTRQHRDDFSSHVHRGGRELNVVFTSCDLLFQFTRPRGGAIFRLPAMHGVTCFNSRTRKGCDPTRL